jgi:hypothetical protein
MRSWFLHWRMSLRKAVAAASLLGIASVHAASPVEPGVHTIQAQYYYYYDPYYYSRYYRCEEDLGYGRRGNWGCG